MPGETETSIQQRVDETFARHKTVDPTTSKEDSLLRLAGRTAFITGASGEIGGRIAELYVIHGADVIIHGRNREKLDSLAEVLQAMKARVEVLEGDVADPETAAKLSPIVDSKFGGKMEILVNNAGAPNDMVMERMTVESWFSVVGPILNGAFFVTKASWPYLQKAGRAGRIINNTSISGLLGNEGQPAYSAAKAGLAGLAKSNSRELFKTGGTANAVALGPVESPVWDGLKRISAARVARGREDPLDVPRKRMLDRRFMSPEEAALTFLFLASDAGAFITGQEVPVEAGLMGLKMT